MFMLLHNLPFSLVELLKALAPDSKIARYLKCSRTKFTSVTNTILRDEGIEDVAKDLRKCKFSVIIDETTDISTKKCLAIVVRYFDQVSNRVRDRFFSLIELQSCDAATIYSTLIDLLQLHQIPTENLIGFASDNASVMVGRIGGVQALLKKDIPFLFVLGCVCHSMHLCSSAASKHIPRYIEKLLRNIYSYFCHSAKRISEFKDLQELFSVKTHKLLKTSATRWLSLEQVIKRVLEQWDCLTR